MMAKSRRFLFLAAAKEGLLSLDQVLIITLYLPDIALPFGIETGIEDIDAPPLPEPRTTINDGTSKW